MTEDNELREYLMNIFSGKGNPGKDDFKEIGLEDMGNGMYAYRIGKGALTGEKGWDEFHRILEEEAKKYLDIKE